MNKQFIILDTETTDKEAPFDFCELAYILYENIRPLTRICKHYDRQG